MAEDKPAKPMPDWVQPMDFEIDPKIPLKNLEKAVKTGYRVERDADTGKAKVVGRVVIKGNEKKDPLDVSK